MNGPKIVSEDVSSRAGRRSLGRAEVTGGASEDEDYEGSRLCSAAS